MKPEFEQGKKEVNNYLRYSGMGFQIAATIGVGVFIGFELDKWLKTSGPYFTLGFSFVFLVLALYIGLKDFGKKDQD
jgi:ATP synthase protein I